MTFSINNFNGEEPTTEYLVEFERKFYSGSKNVEHPIKKSSAPAVSRSFTEAGGEDENEDILGSYMSMCDTPKVGDYLFLFWVTEIALDSIVFFN